MGFLHDATVYLAAAVLAVPLFRWLGFGAVLGYLTAGVAIGPWALGLVDDPQSILHFAEIGVVFLLFVIGLELRPSRLWVLRRAVFGLGGLQVVCASAVVGGLLLASGRAPEDAAVLGLALSLSSTAFVLQLLAEKGELTSSHGRAAFGVLLFQDLAVIPILALLPLLGAQPGAGESPGAWWDPLLTVASLAAFVAGGRYLLRPALRLVAHSGVREVFVAAALLLVLSSALLMEALGISMALGAFAAGVLMADSEFRHELEASIDPFKGLLLGLFFLAVGMSLDVGLLVTRPGSMVGLALLLMAVKAAALFVVARIMGVASGPARRLALVLSQGGEFAFVIFGASQSFGLLDPGETRAAAVVVTLSMALTPLVALFDERVLAPRLDRVAAVREDEPEPEAHPVIVAGFGRTGQVVARLLRARGIRFTALERSPVQLDFVRRFGNRVYYGDAGHLDLLRAAGAAEARLLLVTMSDAEESVRVVETARKHFPQLVIYASARNRQHALALRELGVAFCIRTHFLSSLALAEQVLVGLGSEPAWAARAVELFRRHDERTLDRQFAFYRDDDALVQSAKDAEKELRMLIESDEELAGPSGAGGATAGIVPPAGPRP